MNLKKLVRFLRKNYFIPILVVIVIFIGLITVYKIGFSKPYYVYVKVKVGQGLWWASTQRPSIWQLDAIKKGDTSYDILGKPLAQIISKKYYRYYGSDQLDIYLSIKVRVTYNKRRGEYSLNRSVLSVGSPIDIQFSSQRITGTVIALSIIPFNDRFFEKTIKISKKYANPWEFDSIKIGDKYFDGETILFEVVDKQTQNASSMLTLNTSFSTSGSNVLEPVNPIDVVAKVKLRSINNQWVLGEDQIIVIGRPLNISTPNFLFDNYVVTSID